MIQAKYSKQKDKYYINAVCRECGAQSKTFTSLTDPATGYTDAVMFATMVWNKRPGDPTAGEEVAINGE